MKLSNVMLHVASVMFLMSIQLISALPAQQTPGNGDNLGRPQACGFQNAGAQGNQQQQVDQNSVLNPPPPQGHQVPRNYYPPVNRFRRVQMESVFPNQLRQHAVPQNYYPPVNRFRRLHMESVFPNQLQHQQPRPPSQQ